MSLRLLLMRHGQSEWNPFTGRADPDLTETEEQEATRAGLLLAAQGPLPGLAHTSLQRRAIRSTGLVLSACDRSRIPVRRSWRLNGRHYGALQGRDEDEVIREYGEKQGPAVAALVHRRPATGRVGQRVPARRLRPAAAVLVPLDRPGPVHR